MKKYNISRKNKTHKKYNKTLIRRINKQFNLTRAMKGGVKKPSVKQFIEALETLIKDINDDNTFDVAGAPLEPVNVTKEHATKAQEITFVSDAIAILKANNKITEDSTYKLNNYIGHYAKKKLHEKEKASPWVKSSIDPNTLFNSTDNKRIQVEDLFTQLQDLNIFVNKPDWRKWLEKYIVLLTNYEYIDKNSQQAKINYKLRTMEVAAAAERAERAAERADREADARWAVWTAAVRVETMKAMREMARETGDEEAMAAVEAAAEAEAGLEEVKAAEAVVRAAVRGGEDTFVAAEAAEATFDARMAVAMLAAAEATGDKETMARVKARVDWDARQRQDEADRRAAWKRYEEAASMPPEQPLPPPGTRIGGKSKRIIKINVKSKKKRRNRY